MFSDGSSFYKRSLIFTNLLRSNSAPNAKILADQAQCSHRTAQRVINRLQDEFSLPFKYNAESRGYVLTDPNYKFEMLPPGKDEFATLLLMRELAEELSDGQVIEALNSLWERMTNIDHVSKCDLNKLSEYFTAELSEVGAISENGVLDYLNAAQKGETLEIRYRSPWRHNEDKVYSGCVQKVGLYDGRIYFLFLEESGKEMILNASFVKKFTVLNRALDISNIKDVKTISDSWFYGFGVWAGEELVEIKIKIAHPASIYYEQQIWDETQEDSWEGDVLVRKMKSQISPELVRRLLSLGKFLIEVSPAELKEQVIADAQAMLEGLKRG
jgi:predicted DNA-binding transcriptional regulator YafY